MKYTIYTEKVHKHETQCNKQYETTIPVATTQVMGIEYCQHPQSPFEPLLHAAFLPQVIYNFVIIFLYTFTTCGLVLSVLNLT